MRKRVHMFPYNANSEGCEALARSLGILRIRRENSRYRGRPSKTIINWGNSSLPEELSKSTVLNSPEAVGACSNKLSFFNLVKDQGLQEFIPEFTDSFETALEWVGQEIEVVARTVLNGHSGRGIVLMDGRKPETLVRAPLYVKYIKKMEEYRVHVFQGEVIDLQRKVLSEAKKESEEEINWKVRNHSNGFIFQRNNLAAHESVINSALAIFSKTGLDFGAFDVVFNKSQGRSYVLEVNTAPGIEGTTIENYTTAFTNLLGN